MIDVSESASDQYWHFRALTLFDRDFDHRDEGDLVGVDMLTHGGTEDGRRVAELLKRGENKTLEELMWVFEN
jgi:hypothetical protein